MVAQQQTQPHQWFNNSKCCNIAWSCNLTSSTSMSCNPSTSRVDKLSGAINGHRPEQHLRLKRHLGKQQVGKEGAAHHHHHHYHDHHDYDSNLCFGSLQTCNAKGLFTKGLPAFVLIFPGVSGVFSGYLWGICRVFPGISTFPVKRSVACL